MSGRAEAGNGENARADALPPDLPYPLVTLVDLPRYWYRAAAYGLSLRMAQSSLNLFGATVGVLRLALSALAASAALLAAVKVVESSLPFSFAVAVAAIFLGLALATIPLVRRLGNLARIMDVAARSEESAARLRRDMATGMRNDRAYGQLIDLYRPIVENISDHLAREGRSHRMEIVESDGGDPGAPSPYAAAAIAAQPGDSLHTLLAKPMSGKQHHELRRLGESRQRLMRKWREMDVSERVMEDETGDNYCLHRLSFDAEQAEQIQITASIATYGEIVRSCDALINEFALFAYLTGTLSRRRRWSPFRRGTLAISAEAMLRCLPWRHRAHRSNRARPRDLRRDRFSQPNGLSPASGLFLQPRDRAAGIGIAVVTLDRKEGGDWAFLGVRSGQVGTYPSTNHVAPAGMCNSYGTHLAPQSRGEPPPGDYLETAMRCEYLEELFKEPEFENNRRPDWSERVARAWREKASAVEDLGIHRPRIRPAQPAARGLRNRRG